MKFITWNEKLGRPECPYLIRWAINFGPVGSLRLHHWIRSDDKRAKHDHPSDFITLVLRGSYIDRAYCGWCKGRRTFHPHLPLACPRCKGTGEEHQEMRPGSVEFRKAEHAHVVDVQEGGCWTLLYFFPNRRQWGFYRPRKLDGKLKWTKANKYFLEEGHHPCDQL